MHAAAKLKDSTILVQLLNAGAFVNAPDCRGYTPLHVAIIHCVDGDVAGDAASSARNGHHDIIIALLQYGALRTIENDAEETPVSLFKYFIIFFKKNIMSCWQ
jgi:ankyrin repeat protein